MGSIKLKQRSKEAFISPRVSLSVDLELEDCLLGESKIFSSEIQATGHNVEEYVGDSYWENN